MRGGSWNARCVPGWGAPPKSGPRACEGESLPDLVWDAWECLGQRFRTCAKKVSPGCHRGIRSPLRTLDFYLRLRSVPDTVSRELRTVEMGSEDTRVVCD